MFRVNIDPAHTKGGEQYGERPWLVVSADAVNNKNRLVVAVPLTKQVHQQAGLRDARILVPVNERTNYTNATKPLANVPSLVLTEQVRALARGRLGQAVARFSPAAMRAVEAGLAYVLDLP